MFVSEANSFLRVGFLAYRLTDFILFGRLPTKARTLFNLVVRKRWIYNLFVRSRLELELGTPFPLSVQLTTTLRAHVFLFKLDLS